MGCSLHRGTRRRLRDLHESGDISLRPVSADGACFYRSLTHCMFGDESNWRWVKGHILQYMAHGPEHDDFMEWYSMLRQLDDRYGEDPLLH